MSRYGNDDDGDDGVDEDEDEDDDDDYGGPPRFQPLRLFIQRRADGRTVRATKVFECDRFGVACQRPRLPPIYLPKRGVNSLKTARNGTEKELGGGRAGICPRAAAAPPRNRGLRRRLRGKGTRLPFVDDRRECKRRNASPTRDAKAPWVRSLGSIAGLSR